MTLTDYAAKKLREDFDKAETLEEALEVIKTCYCFKNYSDLSALFLELVTDCSIEFDVTTKCIVEHVKSEATA